MEGQADGDGKNWLFTDSRVRNISALAKYHFKETSETSIVPTSSSELILIYTPARD